MMRHGTLCWLVLLFAAFGAAAQTIADVQKFRVWEDLASQITHITNVKEADGANAFFDSQRAVVADNLEWSGAAGYLIEVRIQVNVMTGHERIIGNPIMLGSGRSPVDAYARAYTSDMLYSPQASPGNVYDPDKSFFFWAELRKPWWKFGGSRLEAGEIPPGLANKVRTGALALISDAHVIAKLKDQHSVRSLKGAIERLRQEAEHSATAFKLEALSDRLEQQRQERRKVMADLEKELERSRRASGVIKTLDTLGNILTVASAVMQASAALDDIDSKDLGSASSVEGVRAAVSEYQAGKRVSVEDLRTQQNAIQVEVLETSSEIRVELRDSGAPSSLLNEVFPDA